MIKAFKLDGVGICAALALWGIYTNSAPTLAATIERHVDTEMGCAVRVSGPLMRGDAESLRRILQAVDVRDYGGPEENHGFRICFDSPGGSFPEGVRLARVIQEMRFGTAIPSGARCESACALAFMAGVVTDHWADQTIPDRHMHSNAKLGFHSPALVVSNNSFSASQVSEAYNLSLLTVSQILNMFGGNHRFPYQWFLETPSNQMRFVETIGEALMLGVNIVDVQFPEQPTLASLQRACQSFLSVEYFLVHGQRTDGTGAVSYSWNSYSDVAKLDEQLFPHTQRTNPWELWDMSRGAQERPDLTRFSLDSSLSELRSISISIPMEDSGGGMRGSALSSCLIRLFIRGSGSPDETSQAAGILGFIEYLPNTAVLGGGAFEGILHVAHLIDPETLLSTPSVRNSFSSSYREWALRVSHEIPSILEVNTVSDSFLSCWLASPTARVTNVAEYANLRRQPDFSAPVVRQVPLSERVRATRADNITVIGQERDRQSCINACQAFGRNAEDRAARDRAQQCIADNMIWYEVTDARNNRGWVSRQYLEGVQ